MCQRGSERLGKRGKWIGWAERERGGEWVGKRVRRDGQEGKGDRVGTARRGRRMGGSEGKEGWA